jgi:xylan 1,4-beta-xylosidase
MLIDPALRALLAAALLATASLAPVPLAAAASSTDAASATASMTIRVPAEAAGAPFPHFWEQMFGSGRAVLALRDNYRRDVRLVKGVTDFRYVRFHGIFHDEVGLYDVDAAGRTVYNFSYVDQIYDGLLADGVRPFIELSFMPQKMAADPKDIFGFWYKPNISPPKDYAQWDAMIDAFVRHLVDRYGIDEVAKWYFEVWNEPNIGFWGGQPQQATYFELYDHTARAIKNVSTRLRVGGPSTAQAAWAGDFIAHVQQGHIPVDFVSSHVYANDTSKDVFQNDIPVPRDQMVCRAVRKVHDEIAHSPLPQLPLIFSEYNASYSNEPDVTDTVYMGPWLASTISQCDGLTEAMSYWSFSDVFEEGGVVRTPFYGGFGLVAEDDIPKPAFNAFALLHRLGETRLPLDSDSALITRRKDGTLVVALWNYAPPDGTGEHYTPPARPDAARDFLLELPAKRAGARATLWRLDADHGNVVRTYDAMGRPPFPSRAQIESLRKAARLSPAQSLAVQGGKLKVKIPAQGLVVIEIR